MLWWGLPLWLRQPVLYVLVRRVMTAGSLIMYRIEIDGHFHGSGNVPHPWVARIDGSDPKYGLRREFIRPLRDYAEAHVAWSGNLYGCVATYPLRDGHLYEVSRLRGRSSKRHVAREFFRLVAGKREPMEPDDALAIAEGITGPAVTLTLRESDDRPCVSEVSGLGTPRRLGFVLVEGERRFRLRNGRIYEVCETMDATPDRRWFVRCCDEQIRRVTEEEALQWLRRT